MSTSTSTLSSSGYLSESGTPSSSDGYLDASNGPSTPRLATVVAARLPQRQVTDRLDDYLEPHRVWAVSEALTEPEGRLPTGSDMDLFRSDGKVFLGLRERLGEGKDKDVYKALELDPITFECRPVAQYNYKKDPGENREDQLLREVRSLHVVEPNIRTFRCEEGKVVAFAPLYGMDLRQAFLHFRGDARTQLHLLRDGARGLADLHAAGIIHRDVKSDNFLTEGLLHLRVADLGRSLKHGEPQEGALRGHAFYFAPEGCGETPVHTEKGDVWAFGKTMYELATGSTFPLGEGLARMSDPAQSRTTYMRRLAGATQQQIDEGWKPVALPVESIIRGCLRVNPAERLTMKQVADTLEHLSHPC